VVIPFAGSLGGDEGRAERSLHFVEWDPSIARPPMAFEDWLYESVQNLLRKFLQIHTIELRSGVSGRGNSFHRRLAYVFLAFASKQFFVSTGAGPQKEGQVMHEKPGLTE
jgi:hypothetical protein